MSEKKYVLLIEDEKFQAQLFARIIESELRNHSIEVKTIDNGFDALQFFLGKKINDIEVGKVGLVLMDLAMHDISGMQVLEKIKAKIPVAVLSANDDDKIRARALELGADEYFVKGKSINELNRLREFIIKKMR
jgi:DNA-binding response OmpR family regulator